MRHIVLVAVALSAAAMPALAADRALTNAEFVRRATPLMKKSPASLVFSGEARRLMKEIGAAGDAVRARQESDLATGRKPATCLPAKGKARMDARELLQHLRELPADQQQQSFRSGFASFAARKFPCKA